jgi:hypothetical protein
MLIVPLLVLASVVFAIRDFSRPLTRWQAVTALVLTIPVGI